MPSFELTQGYYDSLKDTQLDGFDGAEKGVDPLVAEAIKKFAEQLPKGALVLDVPTGAGIEAAELQRYPIKVIPVDLSEKMLSKTVASAAEAGVSDHLERRIQVDALALPFAPASFDGIFSKDFLSLAGLAERIDILKNWRQLLKPGGRLLLVLEELPWSSFIINGKKIRGKLVELEKALKETDRVDAVEMIEATEALFLQHLQAAGFVEMTSAVVTKPTSRWVRDSRAIIIEAVKIT